jgi:hypothetical protein
MEYLADLVATVPEGTSPAKVDESTSGVIKMRKANVGVEKERRNFIKTAGTVLAASPWLSSLAQAESFT